MGDYTTVKIPIPPSAFDAVVGKEDFDYETIQGAYDDGAQSILVSSAYDPTQESYPIKFIADEDWNPVTVRGVGPNATNIGDSNQEANTIEIHGNGNHYGKPVIFADFSITSHADYSVIKSACIPHGRINNVIMEDGGKAITLRGPYIDDYVGGSFDWIIRDSDIWRCARGIKVASGSAGHGITFDSVNINACKGIGLSINGCASVKFKSGAIQLNHGWGVELRNTTNTTITGAYIEGNSRNRDMPIEIYGRGADSLCVRDTYFHGINPRTTPGHGYDYVQRALNLHDSENVAVRDSDARRYGDAFLAAWNSDVRIDNLRLVDDTELTVTANAIVENTS